jgi:P4 family phage/plasmid primase-like protien
MYAKGDFCNYLSGFRVEKGCEFTHTSIIKPSGSFYIPSEEYDNFWKQYKTALSNGEELYLTEKHRDISPFLIDLDFRFEKTANVERKYTEGILRDIVSMYGRYINEYVDTQGKDIDMFLMEKLSPVVDKGLVKDGIHIVIPNIVTKPSLQFIIRSKVLQEIPKILDGLGLKNSYEDVVDEAVIARNNWQMYGSKKPNSTSYKVTHVYRYKTSDGQVSEVQPECLEEDMAELLSIRNKYDVSKIKIDKLSVISAFEDEEKMKHARKHESQKPNNKKNVCDNLELVNKLVDIISPSRADGYESWIRVGWCLRNIDYRLLDTWVNFSKKSAKFEDGECERRWNYMRDDGLGMGTLNMWARQDSPEEYKKIMERDLGNLIYRSRSETHHDIAKVAHFMYKYDFVCVSIKHNYWYEFRNHKWVPCDSGHSLRARLSNDVVKEYCGAAAFYNSKACAEEMEADQQRWLEDAKKLNGIALKLKQSPFKENIIKECRDLFYVEKFEEKLDSRCNLVGFENGVYDLDIGEFREGRPEDYISFSTGINYVPYEAHHPQQAEIDECISKILTKPDIKKYVLTLLASFLHGGIREEKFHIWTGVGANGKSVLISLFESAFGEYCCKFPITLLTQKRAASNAATSELARAKGKRFAVLQEPSEDEKMNVGLMKELSGGDKIQARAIFKEPIEFKPQFKMVLTCNHLPNVPSDDGGTWRRIRVVEFTSRFTEHPDPEKPHEFLIDTELSVKFEDWKEQFMALLINYYKKYLETGVIEPEDVMRCTKEYQRNNDNFLDFVEQEMEKDDRGFISINDAHSRFNSWIKDNAPHLKSITKKNFNTALDKIMGKSVHMHKVHGWKGFSFKKDEFGEMGDDY